MGSNCAVPLAQVMLRKKPLEENVRMSPPPFSLRRAGGFPPQVKGSMGGGQNYKAQSDLLEQKRGLGWT